MRIIVISPDSPDPREVPSMEGFFSAGLRRYHVKKPSVSASDLEAWLLGLPQSWRPLIVLHEHHELAGRLALGGRHEKDWGGYPEPPAASRSCHDLPSLRRNLGRYQYLLFGPVFTSLTKPFYGPSEDFPWEELSSVLKVRSSPQGARVLAIGGITAESLARCADLGFDGAAVLGAVWNEPDPVRAFVGICDKAGLEAAWHGP